jgi:hypothetical protein
MSAFDANLSFGMIFVAAGFGVSPPGNVAHGVQPTHAQMATAVPTTAAIAPTCHQPQTSMIVLTGSHR